MLNLVRISSGIKKRPRAKAFSLVELLISVSIFAVVSVAIYSTFSSGLTVLRRSKNIDLAQQKFLLKIEKFSRDLRQTPTFNKQLFSGTKDKLSFAGIINEMPSRLTYYYDNSSAAFMYNADELSNIIDEKGAIDPKLKSKSAVFINKVKEAKFSYLLLDLKKNNYEWLEEWKEKYLPLALKLNIVTDKQNYETTIFLPTA